MIETIISGGQTGADRAALDFAIARAIPHAGWCPRGRLAEDGVIGDRYELDESPSADPAQRTEWNVRDSDGTVILSIRSSLAGGSKQTAQFAEQHRKPCLHVSREHDGESAALKLAKFVAENRIKTLNVAGPRESEEPEIDGFTREVLEKAAAIWG